MGPQNKIGHAGLRYRRWMQVPVLTARKIGSKTCVIVVVVVFFVCVCVSFFVVFLGGCVPKLWMNF